MLLIPFAFFIVFPLLRCFVIRILSHAGGWNRLPVDRSDSHSAISSFTLPPIAFDQIS